MGKSITRQHYSLTRKALSRNNLARDIFRFRLQTHLEIYIRTYIPSGGGSVVGLVSCVVVVVVDCGTSVCVVPFVAIEVCMLQKYIHFSGCV